MQIERIRWDDLRVLLALYRVGSLKAAASHLEVNISTVSRRLDALEEACGQQLFDRTSSGTRPTASAEALLPFAEQMEAGAIELAHAVDGFETEPTGLVRITAPPGVIDHFLGGAMAELASRHPRLQIEIDSSIGYSDLTRREADIALRIVRPVSGDLVTTRLGVSGFVVVASPGWVRRHDGNLTQPEKVGWVTYCADLAHLPESAWIVSRVPQSSIPIRSNSLTAQLEAVRAGVGATVVPEPFASLPGLSQVALSRKLSASVRAIQERGLWLVGHRALRRVPRVAVVWEFLLALMRDR